MTAEQQTRLIRESEWLWCLDPLDGTSNFAAGIPYFCVSLALLYQGKACLALIYDPVRDECFTAEEGKGAFLNGAELKIPGQALALNKAIAVIDLKRLPAQLSASLASQPPFASQRNFGSGALDWAWLAAARYHYYLHGGQKLWDYTAGHLILKEAGGRATTMDNEPVPVQQLVPRSVVAAIEISAQQQWLQTVQSRLEC
jgi:myo-inositol-1(or 4)-monophosphatase